MAFVRILAHARDKGVGIRALIQGVPSIGVVAREDRNIVEKMHQMFFKSSADDCSALSPHALRLKCGACL